MKKLIKYNGKNIVINPFSVDDVMYKNYFSKGYFYEIRLLEKIKTLNINGVYVDVGANVGNHSLFFSLFCNATKVISIEAEKNIYDILRTNLINNLDEEKYELHNCAISDFNGYVTMSPVLDVNAGSTHVKLTNEGETKCTTLDDLLDNIVNIGLIKMDIEGHELKALKYATNIIKNNFPVIVTEIKNKNEFKEITTFLTKYGYKTDGINYANTPTYIWQHEKL